MQQFVYQVFEDFFLYMPISKDNPKQEDFTWQVRNILQLTFSTAVRIFPDLCQKLTCRDLSIPYRTSFWFSILMTSCRLTLWIVSSNYCRCLNNIQKCQRLGDKPHRNMETWLHGDISRSPVDFPLIQPITKKLEQCMFGFFGFGRQPKQNWESLGPFQPIY